MKLIDRYLITQFLRPLAVCGAIFIILVFVGHFFDKMTVFSNYHAHVTDMVEYLVLGIPYWLNVIFPVATLLALMFSLGPLLQRGEITAMRSAGIPSLRLYAPFLAMGVLISLISLVGGLSFFPSISSKANVIYRQRIKKEPVYNTLRDHIVVAGRDHQRFTIGTLDTKTGTVTDIVIDQFDDQLRHLSTLSAQEGHYQNGQWTFYRGTFIRYDANRNIQQETFQEKSVNIHERPEDFVYENRKPDDMTHRELQERIRHLNELGIPSFKEQVALHLQFALPFANVVVILLGIPFALKSLKKGNVQTIAYAFGATFLYWGTVSVFQSSGEQGLLPAWLAAWAANFIFGILAVWMLQRTAKI
jgi:lipopolysaccharide export system permease protein